MTSIRRRPARRFSLPATLALGLLAATAAFGAGVAISPPAQAQSCLSAAATRSAIAGGQVLPLAAISDAVRARGYAELASASLCERAGGFVYTVVAIQASGASARLTVDAASGAILSER